MRNELRSLVAPNNKLSNRLTSANAGLLLQRGLSAWDKDDKSTKENVIARVCKVTPSELYKKAYNRWLIITSDKSRYAFTVASIVGRLYTGLSSATALETGLTTHHTYGMPMLAGSSVKGAVATYAEQIGLKEKNIEVYQVLFGDENNAGAVIWHDAWWIPNSGKPFVEEIITTHHQDYYNGKQNIVDEMEDPIPNQQIATQGSFYFVVETGNQAWATFAKNLLLQMLENQGMGSKTASGYGYFKENEDIKNNIESIQDEHKERKNRAIVQAQLLKHQQIINKWLNIFQQKIYQISNQEHTNLYYDFKADLEQVCADTTLSTEHKKEISIELAINVIKNKYKQNNWLNDKRAKEIKPLLAKLSGNNG